MTDSARTLVQAHAEGRLAGLEEAAQIADGRESPWSEVHPQEAYINKLQSIVLDASFGYWDHTDDNEPEHTIAVAIYKFLKTGQRAIDHLVGTETIAMAIRNAARELKKP